MQEKPARLTILIDPKSKKEFEKIGAGQRTTSSHMVRTLIQEAARTLYAGYNHSHLHEMLAEEQGVIVSRPTLARVLRAAGIRSPT